MDAVTKNQKLIKVGNSYAVTVDPQFLKENKLEAGSVLTLRYASDGSFITLIPGKSTKQIEGSPKLNQAEQAAVLESRVSPEFRLWVEKSLEEDAKAMKELANL